MLVGWKPGHESELRDTLGAFDKRFSSNLLATYDRVIAQQASGKA